MSKPEVIQHKGGVASIWLGDFDSEAALEHYIDSEFRSDYHADISGVALPEKKASVRMTGIGELLSGFSWWERWIDDAVRMSREQGFLTAKAAAVFYHGYSHPEFAPNASAPLRFVGYVYFDSL